MKLVVTSSRPNKNGNFTYVVVEGTPEQYRDYVTKAEASAMKAGSSYKVMFDTVSGNPLFFSKTLYSDGTQLVLNWDASNYVAQDDAIEQENLEREAAIQQLMRLGHSRENAVEAITKEMAAAVVSTLAQTASRRTFSIVRRAINTAPVATPTSQDNTNLQDLLAPEGKKK